MTSGVGLWKFMANYNDDDNKFYCEIRVEWMSQFYTCKKVEISYLFMVWGFGFEVIASKRLKATTNWKKLE